MKLVTRDDAVATQTQHPWRSTVRTVIQTVAGLAAAAPLLYVAITQQEPGDAVGAAAVALGVSAAITRVMALPVVEQFLRKVGLGAAPHEETVPNDYYAEEYEPEHGDPDEQN